MYVLTVIVTNRWYGQATAGDGGGQAGSDENVVACIPAAGGVSADVEGVRAGNDAVQILDFDVLEMEFVGTG